MEMLLNGLQTNANKEMPSAAISDEGIKQRCIFVGLPELSTPYPSRRASELQVSSMDQEGSWRLDGRLSLLAFWIVKALIPWVIVAICGYWAYRWLTKRT